jgi:hypothetical protein
MTGYISTELQTWTPSQKNFHCGVSVDTERFVYWDSVWIQLWIICTRLLYWDTGSDFFADHVNSGYRTICVSGLGLDLVADHFYYDYCIGTPDQIMSHIV